MHLGCDAWMMLIQPATHMVAMEANTCAKGDMEVALADRSQVKVSQTCCLLLVVCTGDR